MTLATMSRDGNEDLVLFLHGLGCAKENFAELWDAEELAAVSLLAPDLPGHGQHDGGRGGSAPRTQDRVGAGGGSQSANPDVLIHLDSVPKVRIAHAGRFIMIEQPAALASAIAEVITQTRAP